MSNEYLGVVTLAGQEKLAGSIGGTPLDLTTVRVGDGNGATITPNETMTDLVRRRGSAYGILASGRDPVNPTMWRITALVPAADGPFDIREIGVFDADGDMIAIARHPFVEKRSPAQGNAVELTTDIVFPVSDTAQITINLLPDVAVHIGMMLRAPFLVVESATTTAPPASPALGATYVIPGSGATGAWAGAGVANRLAQWNGDVWVVVNVPEGHQVVANDQVGASRYLSRSASGWAPNLPSAVQSLKWNYAVAGGTANSIVVAPDPAWNSYEEGAEIHILLTANVTGPLMVNVSGLGGKSAVHPGGGATANLDYLAGDLLKLKYDGTRFLCLTPINLAVITSNITRTVYGSASPDFASLVTAMAWLSRRRIASSGGVTFNLAAGQFSHSASIFLDHPDQRRVSIVGANLALAPPSAVTFFITGQSPAARATDRAGHLAALRAIYTTELVFTGGTSIAITGPEIGLSNVLITGDRTGTQPSAGLNIFGGARLSNVSIANFGFTGINVANGLVSATGVISATGCVADGIAVTGGGTLNITTGTYAASNDGNGFLVNAGFVLAGTAGGFGWGRGHGGGGLQVSNSGQFTVSTTTGSTFQTNTGHGIASSQGSGSGLFLLANNLGWGMLAYQSRWQMPLSAFSANTLGSVSGAHLTIVDVQSGTGVSGSSSPAVNVVGNQQSLIVN